ncbi:protein RIK isoform X3 [Senna tora]|uniref:Protein RIK isoform X3 n=1 Tax=Senna tora TaxID=362788 RepID=A0A834W8C0_9FABA|nr:protein RIK isoform X3 [Senna tora]
MVEEMLRQSQNSPPISSTSTSHPAYMANGVKVLSTCVFLGFDVDPSLNIVARIRGPNGLFKCMCRRKMNLLTDYAKMKVLDADGCGQYGIL